MSTAGYVDTLPAGVRLDVFRLFVNMGTGGTVAGEIASTLDVSATSFFSNSNRLHGRKC